ncbi:class E sortase [Streptomyces sp. YIM 130001]|uniref:class E sortase n=1 Tax=Streptomyces sp. YIM 130001 TaxID=2259644 RepID=UPI001F08946D|nr:class E sortase [Streptomyces sp. YIM 130001]
MNGAEAGSFAAAVDGLADPLTDPLPGGHPSPWFRTAAPGQDQEWYDPQGYREAWHSGPADPVSEAADQRPPVDANAYEAMYTSAPGSAPAPGTAPAAAVPLPVDDATVGLRTADTRRPHPEPEPTLGPELPLGAQTVRTGGRAERRRAAARPDAGLPGDGAGGGEGRPLSRVEARRAERARKPGPGVVASRALGELFITVGVVLLLFVTYQLWWTNIRAGQQAGSEASRIQQDWADGKRKPGAFEPGQGFAIMHIPKLDIVVPIAEGIDKKKVLDRGMVGHYAQGALKTAMPDAKKGNFAVAGHRNTHGEPFRYVNRLEAGDPIVVETRDTYYVYKMASILPQTSPGNTAVIDPVPKGSGFTKPGRYLTLTTCTPEFTSTYRMIVWGKMAEERPRSKGKPDALIG